jgi:polyvinyl alcohol dehydrogenase (cytochrome)
MANSTPMQHRVRYIALAAAVVVGGVVSQRAFAAPAGNWFSVWTMGGHDLFGSRSNPFERELRPSTVKSLTPKWTAATDDVSATPAVQGSAVYFPDWGGSFWKLDARSGRAIWRRQVADYVGIPDAVSRTSPAIVGDTVYIGTQSGAYLLAIDTETGALRWRRQLDEHPEAILTQSPVVFDGVVYEGVSSGEEGAATDPDYPCCTFRGSVVATDARTGRVLWKTFMIPDQGPGTDVFSGGAVWGGTPVIDPFTQTVYVTTGNNYEIPESATACQTSGGTAEECLPAWNIINSFVALDLRTGAIRWTSGPKAFDTWNVACLVDQPPPNNCPVPAGPDYDFGDGPHLFFLHPAGSRPRVAVGGGDKGGQYFMLDARTGEVIWSATVGPGGILGGIEWGTASDGERIYFTESDADELPYALPDGRTITWSSFGALDPATGKTLWQVPEPHGGLAHAAVSTAGGVVYAGAMSGYMYALDARTGARLWEFLGEASSNAGPAIVDGSVYWGNGYSHNGGTVSHTFYAFALPQHARSH